MLLTDLAVQGSGHLDGRLSLQKGWDVEVAAVTHGGFLGAGLWLAGRLISQQHSTPLAVWSPEKKRLGWRVVTPPAQVMTGEGRDTTAGLPAARKHLCTGAMSHQRLIYPPRRFKVAATGGRGRPC